MTQQTRSKILNLGIIIAIISTIVALVIYCILSPNDNLFCTITATSNDKTLTNIIVSEYKQNNSKQSFLSTPKPKDALWTGLINKASKTEQEKQSAKPIIINNNQTYYAYHITIKNKDKQTISYAISIDKLNSEQFDIVYGVWDKAGFVADHTLNNGLITPDKTVECYIIIKSKVSTPTQQSKKININISTTTTNL